MSAPNRYALLAGAAFFALSAADASACCMGSLPGAGVAAAQPSPIAATSVQAPAPAMKSTGPAMAAPMAPPASGCGGVAAGCGVSGPIVGVPVVQARPPGAPYHPGVGGAHVNVVTNTQVTAVVAPSVHLTKQVAANGSKTVILRSGGYAPVGEAMAVQSLGPVVSESETAETQTRTRTTEQVWALRAVCIDDKGTPHPASQTFAGENTPKGYQGELFRCIAGTRMEVTKGRLVDGKPVFDGATVLACAKGEALVRAGEEIVCQTQVARRPCNERSLLRRYGPGIKIVRAQMTERYEERVARREIRQLGAGMMMDGGVGQGVY